MFLILPSCLLFGTRGGGRMNKMELGEDEQEREEEERREVKDEKRRR